MPDYENNPRRNNLEELCRQASQEVDSGKLNALIEKIDRLRDEKHKARSGGTST